MQFDKNEVPENFGKAIGFIATYIIFTLIFFYFLNWLGKLPESWNIFHAGIITMFIVLTGILINLILRP